jgi:drug/metabolite transporter (DMT)-like permease
MFSNEKTKPQHTTRDSRLLVVVAFACIYLIWGSTYLAIRYAVETIPPLFVASFRHLIAGALLFAWCWHRGLRPVRQQWLASIVLAVLFFLIGHGTLHWAQQTLPSGMAALLVATEPIFVAIIIMIAGRARITFSLLMGVLLGLGGVALIFGADLRTGRSEILTSLVVLIGTVSWSIGMVYSRSARLHPDSHMAAGMSLLAGAVLLFLGGAITGEMASFHLTAVSMKSLGALAYLATAGSLVAYSAYFWLLDRFPPTLVSTHTYVNPLVALALGWAIAGEVLAPRVVVGGLIVIAAIAWMSRATAAEAESNEQRSQTSAAKKKAA